MKRLTAEWVQKAEADWIAVRRLSRASDLLHDVICFHCQQCAEKYLKSLLEELGQTVPRTHNLVALLPLLVSHHRTVRSWRRGLDFLTRFAVTTRYPGDNASKRQATAAARWADRIRHFCRVVLCIRTPRRRRKTGPKHSGS